MPSTCATSTCGERSMPENIVAILPELGVAIGQTFMMLAIGRTRVLCGACVAESSSLNTDTASAR